MHIEFSDCEGDAPEENDNKAPSFVHPRDGDNHGALLDPRHLQVQQQQQHRSSGLGGATPEMEKFLERISLASPAPPRKRRDKAAAAKAAGAGAGGETAPLPPGRKPLPRQGQGLLRVADRGAILSNICNKIGMDSYFQARRLKSRVKTLHHLYQTCKFLDFSIPALLLL